MFPEMTRMSEAYNVAQKIDVEIRKLTDIYIELIFKNVPLPILNALRRIIQLEVPVMAIDEVIFYENSTVLYDEIIAHRLGLIPLRSEEALDKYGPPEKCIKCMESYYAEASEEAVERPSSKDCENCFIYIRGSVENLDEEEMKTFYSGDLLSDDPDVVPVYKEIPIVILGPHQRLSFDAKARLGRGIEHSKFSPVSVAGVRYVAEISTNSLDDTNLKDAEKCLEYCPVKILEISYEDKKILVKDPYECILCMQCVKRCPENSIKISYKKDQYILFFESIGQLSIRKILLTAIDIFINKIDYLLQQIKEMR